MSILTPAELCRYLRISHSADDALLQVLIDASEAEACRFLNRSQLPTQPLDYPGDYDSNGSYVPGSEASPSSQDPLAPDVRLAIYYLVQSKYEGLAPDLIASMRMAAETILMPYRTALGV